MIAIVATIPQARRDQRATIFVYDNCCCAASSAACAWSTPAAAVFTCASAAAIWNQRAGGAIQLRRPQPAGRVDKLDRSEDNPGNQTDGQNAQRAHDHFDSALRLLLQIEQHDDKQKEHDDRAGINQHLHRRQKEGVQQDKKTGQRNDGQHQKHGAGHRVAADRIGDDERAAHQGQRGKYVEEDVLHSYLFFHFQIWS